MVAKSKSGLRRSGFSFGASERVKSAKSVVEDLLNKKFKGRTVKKLTFGSSSLIIGDRYFTDSKKATQGGFEIHDGSRQVALVHVSFAGKPKIFVEKGNEKFGKALSDAFKEYAGYSFAPKVKSFKKGFLPNHTFYDAEVRSEMTRLYAATRRRKDRRE
ncbi:MAG: hypothetical protein ACE5DI_05140 [Candidatus Micrarchaeia archaeon]